MLIYKSQGQELFHNDVVMVNGTDPYIVAYSLALIGYVLYPLGGHSLAFQHVDWLDGDVEWEYLGNVGDKLCYDQLVIAGGLNNYLSQANEYLQGFSKPR